MAALLLFHRLEYWLRALQATNTRYNVDTMFGLMLAHSLQLWPNIVSRCLHLILIVINAMSTKSTLMFPRYEWQVNQKRQKQDCVWLNINVATLETTSGADRHSDVLLMFFLWLLYYSNHGYHSSLRTLMMCCVCSWQMMHAVFRPIDLLNHLRCLHKRAGPRPVDSTILLCSQWIIWTQYNCLTK